VGGERIVLLRDGQQPGADANIPLSVSEFPYLSGIFAKSGRGVMAPFLRTYDAVIVSRAPRHAFPHVRNAS
jgi:hypothetical protein